MRIKITNKWHPEWGIRKSINIWLKIVPKKWVPEGDKPTEMLDIKAFPWLALIMANSKKSLKNYAKMVSQKAAETVSEKAPEWCTKGHRNGIPENTTKQGFCEIQKNRNIIKYWWNHFGYHFGYHLFFPGYHFGDHFGYHFGYISDTMSAPPFFRIPHFRLLVPWGRWHHHHHNHHHHHHHHHHH